MTSGPEEERRLLLLDACCLLNLFATRHIEAILRTLQKRFAIAAAVSAEAMWIYRGGAGEDALERDAVDSRPLVAAGLLEVLTLETEAENEDFVAFATVLDDGEAMTVALAVHRGGTVATDDRKARREIVARTPQVGLFSTAELLQMWARATGVDPTILARVLQDVHTRAQFLPRSQDPLRAWWDAASQQP